MPNFQKTKEYTCSMKSNNLSNMHFYGFPLKRHISYWFCSLLFIPNTWIRYLL